MSFDNIESITTVCWLWMLILSFLTLEYRKLCYGICFFCTILLTPFIFACIEEKETECCVRILILLACIFSFLIIKSLIVYVRLIKDKNATKLVDKLNLLFDELIFELIVCGGIGILVLAAILYFLLHFLLPA